MAAKQCTTQWYEIESRFRAGDDPKKIAADYGVKLNTLLVRARRYHWRVYKQTNVSTAVQEARERLTTLVGELEAVTQDISTTPQKRRARVRELVERHNEILAESLLKMCPPENAGELRWHAELGAQVANTADRLHGFSEEASLAPRVISIEFFKQLDEPGVCRPCPDVDVDESPPALPEPSPESA